MDLMAIAEKFGVTAVFAFVLGFFSWRQWRAGIESHKDQLSRFDASAKMAKEEFDKSEERLIKIVESVTRAQMASASSIDAMAKSVEDLARKVNDG